MANETPSAPLPVFSFETHPDRYRHWKLQFSGDRADLVMAVDEQGGLVPGYVLKLNSYDLGVDIELADAVQRLRFEHPEVSVVVVRSAHEKVFCAGANIPMLSQSTHAWKVNFCKFTNETRIGLEDASARSGLRFLAALNGTTAGGGYELALACDEMVLVDDGNSAVSLPEVPLLGVLPGTGGLTRLVDKRKVRRDRADVFCTVAEGIKGKRAVQWGLVDALASRSQFDKVVAERAKALSSKPGPVSKADAKGITLDPLNPQVAENKAEYKYVRFVVDPVQRVAEVVITGPSGKQPSSAQEIQEAGADQWSLRAFRELDDAILRLRFQYPQIGLLVVKTSGDLAAVQASDEGLAKNKTHWLANEILAFQSRVLRRLETSAKSVFAVADEGSCFAGVLLETALGADRFYMLNDDDGKVAVAISPANSGAHIMGNSLTRLQSRFLAEPSRVGEILERNAPISTADADDLGLVTLAPDSIDWEDELRVAIEERVSLSPDALTGMEASLRFAGPETCDTKIFGRLSAWQNWIFQRPNAVGETGALSLYGKPTRPSFDYRRC